jgi:hypothetical protein
MFFDAITRPDFVMQRSIKAILNYNCIFSLAFLRTGRVRQEDLQRFLCHVAGIPVVVQHARAGGDMRHYR